MDKEEIISLPNGVSKSLPTKQSFDWSSIRVMAEAGVSYKEICGQYAGLQKQWIADRSKQEKWMTPSRERKMRKQIAIKQAAALANTGDTRSPAEIMEEVWQERGRHINEVAYNIAAEALKSAEKREIAHDLIDDAKDLDTIVKIGRKVTGQDAREQENNAPQVAVNIGLLRSTHVVDL